ncbi:branched-chain amino acid ABC transporter permease [Azospirillum sp. RWY-5-1]|uniref:Branched-chain amino acid ABC transporter permease n=1 Tax=Azospirillum oleiclasticum TaxID=2735135 RepID=A0ABX2T9F3_9PROT|nr:branched-chain amino acid ABC transporter permease [Azospirillum oleiclasticum]NYZ13679.1 branched-chain amino acid ABC transporter permease [Azospirillum oleiclasticum]NYZ20951.1 branched-chain amino acid ABC transporter permease [Azospirillum oleiclasticum]
MTGVVSPMAAPAALRGAGAWKPAELLFWTLPVIGWFAFPENLPLLTQIAITALFALSLDLVLGVAGMVTLGHAAFFGVGAYAAGMLPAYLGIGDPLLGLVAAAAAAALAGALTSPLMLRGSGLSQLMVSVGINAMLYEAANKATEVTGGVDGLPGVENTPLFGMWSFDLYGRTAYVYAVVVLLLLFWMARRVVRSPFGVSLRGIRLNAARMPALGVPVNRRLAVVWTLAAAYAGVAGALLTQTTQFVSINVLGFDRSAEVLLILILGGAGHLYGALVGAVAYMSIHHLLADIDPEFWQFWIGLIFIVVVLFARDGALGAAARIRDLIRNLILGRGASR